MSNSATVYVIDDDSAVRSSLKLLLSSVGHDVRAYGAAQEFLDEFRDTGPGCLILDIRMPGMSGLELQRHLRDRGCEIPVIMITGHGDVPIAVKAMKDGAMEFLQKPFSKQLLLEHVSDALHRDRLRMDSDQKRQSIKDKVGLLTPRELEVMKLIAAGKLSKEVAVSLGISKKTVDVHRSKVMHKLGAHSLADVVQMDLLLSPPSRDGS